VVTDLAVPGIDGFEFCRALHEQGTTRARFQIIAVTGRPEYLDEPDSFRQAGIARVLTKPCDPEVIAHELRRLLNGSATIRRGVTLTAAPEHQSGPDWRRVDVDHAFRDIRTRANSLPGTTMGELVGEELLSRRTVRLIRTRSEVDRLAPAYRHAPRPSVA
jgi:DNA-binding response OmpR family regulator